MAEQGVQRKKNFKAMSAKHKNVWRAMNNKIRKNKEKNERALYAKAAHSIC